MKGTCDICGKEKVEIISYYDSYIAGTIYKCEKCFSKEAIK